MTVENLNLDRALSDANIFDVGGPTWIVWRAITKAAFGVPLSDDEMTHYTARTGRDTIPARMVRELWINAGRRAGKDRAASIIILLIAIVLSEFVDFKKYLSRGERGVILLIAVDRDQAQVAFQYIRAWFDLPAFKPYLKSETRETIELTSGLLIQVATNDKRRIRGRTVIAAVLDEVAFFHGSDQDGVKHTAEAVLAALRPSMLTIPVAMLIGISSPHAARGVFHRMITQHYGKPSDRVLVAQGATWDFNLSITRDDPLIEQAYADDPLEAAAEYGAEFRSDLENPFPKDILSASVDPLPFRPPEDGVRYVANVDPSGGSGGDSYTLAIGHLDGSEVMIDLVSEIRPRFDPASATATLAEICRDYGIGEVHGDRYAGGFPRSMWQSEGIDYVINKLITSDIYAATIPVFMAGRVRLIDNAKLVDQFSTLERSNAQAKPKIDHPKHHHDDLATSVAGVIWRLTKAKSARVRRSKVALPMTFSGRDVTGIDDLPGGEAKPRQRISTPLMRAAMKETAND